MVFAISKAAWLRKLVRIGPFSWLRGQIRSKFYAPLGETLLRICYGPIREQDQVVARYCGRRSLYGAGLMNRRDLLLTVLACADGRSYTPAQIQKAMFLLSRQMPGLVQEGPEFAFRPYDFGPFDAGVYHEADILGREGQAVVVPSGSGNWRTYAASGEGVARGKQLLNQLAAQQRDFVVKVSDWVRAQSFNSLVKSIYEAYPDMKVNSIFRG
jgi:hypothetical protein